MKRTINFGKKIYELKENEEVIIVSGDEYVKYVNEKGRVCLKQYIEKHKIWLELKFSNEEHGVREFLMKELSEDFIRMTALSI